MNSGIILMAGTGERSALNYNKTLYEYMGKPLFMYSVEAFLKNELIDEIILVINPNDEKTINDLVKIEEEIKPIKLIYGGTTRNDSLKKALRTINSEKIIVHDAARPHIIVDDITKMLKALDEYDIATYYHKVVDTIKDGIKTLNRNNLKAVTTPQGFKKELVDKILNNQEDVFDELQIFENDNIKFGFLEETHDNKKFTYQDDFQQPQYLIGHSLDFHPLVINRKLILGGIEFDYPKGLQGHSDADVVYHAVTEAIIGALNLGDIGTLFPDTDQLYKDIDSSYFLKYMKKVLEEKGYQINNIDVIIYLEKPNLKNYKREIAKNISIHLGISDSIVNVKATTMEKKGVIGKEEGIASEAIVLLKK